MPASEGAARRSNALIIAADRYADRGLGELRSPSRDAEELAAVLQDPAIGGYGTQVLLNEPGHLVTEEIEGFFAGRSLDELLVLYLSCHGIKDLAGRLFFAASTTKLSRLAATGISADFVYEQVDRCRARKILLLLDCCYSGAYLKGHRPRAQARAGIGSVGGQGRAVITSSTALEYSFEIDTGRVTGRAAPSVFTAALVDGLRTGEADRDGDGLVSLDDLYRHVYDKVREATPHQTPEKKWGDIRGDFIIAKNPRPPSVQREPLAPKLLDASRDAVPGPTRRRVLYGLVVVSAAGLATAGWELSRRSAPRRAPGRGTKIWSFHIGALAANPPAVFDGVVYAGGEKLYALRASDGKPIWDFGLPGGVAAGPWADAGLVYVGCGKGYVFTLRAADGKVVWRSAASIVLSQRQTEAGGVVYLTKLNGDMEAVRGSDGTIIWTSRAEIPDNEGGSTISGGVIYIAGAYSLAALRTSDGKQIWQSPTDVGLWAPAAGNGIVCSGWKTLYALRARDGTKIWHSSRDAGYSGAPTVSRGVVYIGGFENDLYALRADDGTEIWKSPTSSAVGAPPTVRSGVVYVGSYDKVCAIDANHGEQIWSFQTQGDVWQPTVVGGVTYVGSRDGNIYALRA